MTSPVFVLGGHQTDFARQWTREGKSLAELCAETAQGALAASRVAAREIEVGHVGNFAGELYSGQGHLGGLLVEADRAFTGLPTSRHEAACASGSVAVLAAMADLQAGRYDVALVLGVELMRTVSSFESQKNLAAAAWVPRETEGVEFPWPQVFSDLGDEYERRFGLDRRHLAALARKNFANARRNPNAQTRGWQIDERSFDEDEGRNPVVAGRIRRHDCSQVTDGGAALVLANARFAQTWARREDEDPSALPRIRGFGHRTARFAFRTKLAESEGQPYVFPHVRGAIEDAFRRAALPGVEAIDCIETHDCFTTTEYMAIDHLGLTPPGQGWRAIEEGVVELGGKHPINPSGGLIGAGHPVGASGVRMLLDATKQVRGEAGEYQVEGARTAATLNIGGSATTTVCFVVGRDTDR